MTDTTQPPAETLARPGKIDPCEYCFGVTRHDANCRALTRRAGGTAIPAGMKPWHGGDAAPADWDGGAVLLATGYMIPNPYTWQSHYSEGYIAPSRVIAYTPKPPAGGDAGAAEERDALLSALGWKTGPFRDALSRKVILDDSAALRPEMVKARQAAQEAQCDADDYRYMLGEYVHGSRSGVLGRLWKEVKRLRAATPKPPAGGDAVGGLWKPAGEDAKIGWPYAFADIEAVRDQAEKISGHDGTMEFAAEIMRQADARYHALAIPAPVVEGERWRHVKRGTVYEVIGYAELQNGNVKGLREGAELAVYRGEDGKLWARERGEFHDGRFTALSEDRSHG